MSVKKFKHYALFCFNNKTKSLKLIDIYDDFEVSYEMLKYFESKCRKKYISFEVCPCDVPSCKNDINYCLINMLYNIANCLNIAERGILKSKYDYSQEWFNLAKERSIVAARYLDFIDGTEK